MIVRDAYGYEVELAEDYELDLEIAMVPQRHGARLFLHPWNNTRPGAGAAAAFAQTAKKEHQKATVAEALAAYPAPSLPCTIVLTRVAHRGVLDDDGVPDAMKYVRDEVARWMGLNSDRKPGLRFLYGQQRTSRKGFLGVRVTIYERNEST